MKMSFIINMERMWLYLLGKLVIREVRMGYAAGVTGLLLTCFLNILI